MPWPRDTALRPRAAQELPEDERELEHLSDDESIAERRANLGLRATFRAEPVDRAWAPGAERLGREMLGRVPELRTAVIECRSTMCEVRPPDISEEGASRLIMQLTRDRDLHREFASLRNTGDENLDDDADEPVWYLRRAAQATDTPDEP